MTRQQEIDRFVDYVWDFYGGKSPLYNYFIGDITKQDIVAATTKLLNTEYPWGGGDTLDREMVRDLMLTTKGKKAIEYEHGLKKYGLL